MTEYVLDIELTFNGTVTVEADSEDEAREIAESNFNATIGNLSDGGDDRIVDWDVGLHSSDTYASTPNREKDWNMNV